MASQVQGVALHGCGWAVAGAENSRNAAHCRILAEAIDQTVEIAGSQRSEVLIHGSDGRVREWNCYGNDPFPPRGQDRREGSVRSCQQPVQGRGATQAWQSPICPTCQDQAWHWRLCPFVTRRERELPGKPHLRQMQKDRQRGVLSLIRVRAVAEAWVAKAGSIYAATTLVPCRPNVDSRRDQARGRNLGSVRRSVWNSGGIESTPSSARSRMVPATFGATPKPILNPPLAT